MPTSREDLAAAERLRVGFDLHELGVEAKELKLRRDDPTADDATIYARLADWLGHNGFKPEQIEGLTPRPQGRRRSAP